MSALPGLHPVPDLDQLLVVVGARRFDPEHREAAFLRCVRRLEEHRFDALDEFLAVSCSGRGVSGRAGAAMQAAVECFRGTPQDSAWLTGLRHFQRLGRCGPDSFQRAYRSFCGGIEAGDSSGRCHSGAALCLEHGRGSLMSDCGPRQDSRGAAALYRQGVLLGSASACVSLGLMHRSGAPGVPRDSREAARLFLRAHLAGDPSGTVNLADMVHCSPRVDFALVVRLYRHAHSLGCYYATCRLRWIWQDDAESVIPYSCWQPLAHVHEWVPEEIRLEIRCLLMGARRSSGALSRVPKEILLRVCFFLVCRPRELPCTTGAALSFRGLIDHYKSLYVPFLTKLPAHW